MININIDITFNTLLEIYISEVINYKRKLSDRNVRKEIFTFCNGMLEYATSIGEIKSNEEYFLIYDKLIKFLYYEG